MQILQILQLATSQIASLPRRTVVQGLLDALLHHSLEVLVLHHELEEDLGVHQLVNRGGGAGERGLGLGLLAAAVLVQVSAGGEHN